MPQREKILSLITPNIYGIHVDTDLGIGVGILQARTRAFMRAQRQGKRQAWIYYQRYFIPEGTYIALQVPDDSRFLCLTGGDSLAAGPGMFIPLAAELMGTRAR